MVNKRAILSPEMLLSFDLKFVNMCKEEDSTGNKNLTRTKERQTRELSQFNYFFKMRNC